MDNNEAVTDANRILPAMLTDNKPPFTVVDKGRGPAHSVQRRDGNELIWIPTFEPDNGTAYSVMVVMWGAQGRFPLDIPYHVGRKNGLIGANAAMIIDWDYENAFPGREIRATGTVVTEAMNHVNISASDVTDTPIKEIMAKQDRVIVGHFLAYDYTEDKDAKGEVIRHFKAPPALQPDFSVWKRNDPEWTLVGEVTWDRARNCFAAPNDSLAPDLVAECILARRGQVWMADMLKKPVEEQYCSTQQKVQGDEVTWTVTSKKDDNSQYRHHVMAVLWDEYDPADEVLGGMSGISKPTTKGDLLSAGSGYTTVFIEKGVNYELKMGESVSFTGNDVASAVPASASSQRYVLVAHLQGEYAKDYSRPKEDDDYHFICNRVARHFTLWERAGKKWRLSTQLNWDYETGIMVPNPI